MAKYNSDMVGDEEVRWDKGGIVRQDILHFTVGKEMVIATYTRF